MKTKWKFTISGDSPEIGAFTAGEVRDDIPDNIAKIYAERCWIERVPDAAPVEASAPKSKNAVKEG